MVGNIPKHVIDSVSCLLSPYGVDFAELMQHREAASVDCRYLTARQASAYCGLKPKTIRDKALSGEIRSIRLGNTDKSRVLIDKSDLDNWLARFASHHKQQMA
jgi:excisionase family DNA binding protein